MDLLSVARTVATNEHSSALSDSILATLPIVNAFAHSTIDSTESTSLNRSLDNAKAINDAHLQLCELLARFYPNETKPGGQNMKEMYQEVLATQFSYDHMKP